MPELKTTALWEMALNPLHPLPERLGAALQALALYDAEVRKLRGLLRAGGVVVDEEE